ncbi:hypothetical protein BD626DRAFT_631658 [Schizophyllum amplum]|uniref:1-phosphatidylinositol-3-phosphate 5-kinase n=1 Tax=Schizophyllum amplum TaxID=97359 RepID=A0A550C9S3_9AGAR|nr:hypothetical protein BD626DRAFT_631658 [Auriculariopsis ampla]
MENPQVSSPPLGSLGSPYLHPRSNTDVTSLTSFNPFSEEDENDQSSYTLVTSILSRVKNTLAAPLTSTTNITPPPTSAGIVNNASNVNEQRRPSMHTQSSNSSRQSHPERPNLLLSTKSFTPAPPAVSLGVAEVPLSSLEYERSPSRGGNLYSTSFHESPDSGIFGTSIPGFPIQDDARSIRTANSLHRSGSVSKVIRRIRGEGLSKDYWMDDENCKECYDCKGVFTAWRRKHHCRICGQIFCSRCASNIIKGSRFGHDGMVRVCNLCVEKLAKVDDDDDDDRRSIVSSMANFPAHQFGSDSLSLSHHPQSPFAASQLFGRDEPFNLYSIAETRRPISGSDESGFNSRPYTPDDLPGSLPWEHFRDSNPAPFRRDVADEDNVEIDVDEGSGSVSPADAADRDKIAFPTTEDGKSCVQFPIGSPDNLDSPRPRSRARSRMNSDHDAATPFIRSRVQSRLDNLIMVEPGWRTRRESTAYAHELNLTSMMHLKVMLRQMLTIERIPNVREWEDVLLKLALRIARELTFTTLPHRQGEDMDVRRYVKIKKIPGGAPKDSEYVDGAVITKNVAHKAMSRFQKNPRVMLVTFPLEFSRVEGQYLHFGQIVRQEKEYLTNLASRIAALRPHVVLVEKSVSRIALDALAAHNIAVARTVKPSAIQMVARMTQSDVFSSIDKLALEPRLGHCARYRSQTFDHPLIPGRRKTYMRFEGCHRDMGCTLILRGADNDTLCRVKKVTRFLTFIVRNLKLETHLWKDSVITMPSLNPEAVPTTYSRSSGAPSITAMLATATHTGTTPFRTTPTPELHLSAPGATITEVNGDDDLPDADAEEMRLSRRIDQSLEPYRKTFISVSATLRFPPPYPIRKMKELNNKIIDAKQAWEDEVIRREERVQSAHQHEITITADTTEAPSSPPEAEVHEVDTADLHAQIEALPSPSLAHTPRPGDTPSSPPHSAENGGYFAGATNSASGSSLSTSTNNRSTINGGIEEEPVESLKTEEDIAPESRYSFLKWQHEEARRVWEWYLRKNGDDFVVEKYQCISMLEYTVPMADLNERPCTPPQLKYITFYGENDCTLGQFVEKEVTDTLVQFLDPKAVCTGKGCDQPLARHCKVFLHNETRLVVAVEQWDGQIIGHTNFFAIPDLVTTWSACKVCGSATPFIPVSEEMLRYSFAKFIELHFYPADVQLVQGAGCQHNIYQHHIRYFALRGMTVRFQTDPVTLHEVNFPPFRIRVRPETQLELKNKDFEKLHYRNVVWYSALIDDLRLISMDAATGDEEMDARLLADVNALISRAEEEREDISRLINRIYRDSAPTDTLALNQVHSYRQDKIVAWQADFDKLPKPRTPNALGGDRNSKRASTFGSVRAMWPRKYGDWGEHIQLPSTSVSEAEEGTSSTRRSTGESYMSSASEASETESTAEPDRPPSVLSKLEGGTSITPITESPTIDNSEPSPQETPLVVGTMLEAPDMSEASKADDTDKSDVDAESDSTIGADELTTMKPAVSQGSDGKSKGEQMQPGRVSRLPRSTANQPTVAELVRKYQDYLPAQGVQDLAKTAFPPAPLPPKVVIVSESDQEYPAVPTIKHKHRSRSRPQHRILAKKSSISDFESSYAANIAPRYLTHRKVQLSRFAAPVASAFESRDSSRRTSPEKGSKVRDGPRSQGTISPPLRGLQTPSGGKGKTPKPTSRPKERVPSAKGGVPGFRRPTSSSGNKVNGLTRHYERLNREADRRRYAVIRGKRARPVASSRATVEVLESIKDAMKDEDESDEDEASSEADDEGDENEDADTRSKSSKPEPATEDETDPSSQSPKSEVHDETSEEPPAVTFPQPSTDEPAAPPRPTSIGPSIPPGPISLPPSPFLTSMKHTLSLTPPPPDLDIGPPGTERTSILKALSGLWQPGSTVRNIEVEDPMSDPEHIFRDSSMVVRTDEPTSIIALALNSPQYREMLAKSRAEKRTAREARVTESGGEAFMPDDRSVADSSSTWGVVNVDSAELPDPTEDMKTPSSKLPWAISFESGGLMISCTVLYPEQFDALRRTYDCEKSMIESLARCFKWDASGGKSGSAFLKTRDDRFIAKELSRPELATMETFAPAYFDYMSSAVSADRPTLLAKVFGCYKLTWKRAGKDRTTGKSYKSTQMNLLVMENLFYDRRFSKIYDLKGSTRNRHVQSTGKINEVLLDENLIETMHERPFYVREHSKRILRGALLHDTRFLADINVMDYSLVCGVDSATDELVVGIVDYIRTYTWDKKLESWVKESTFLGGGGRGEPTIVTPKQYRQRFLAAMERYFPMIPDRWMKQKDAPEDEVSGRLQRQIGRCCHD